jgi:hypothetical protein
MSVHVIHCSIVIWFGIQRKDFVIEHPSKNVVEKIVIESDYLSTTCRIVSIIILSRLTPYVERLTITTVEFDTLDQLLMRHSAFIRYGRGKWKLVGTLHD